MYHQNLQDHFRNPRNRGRLDHASFRSVQYNPSCGDVVTFEGIVEEGVLVAVAFEGEGCVVSQAAASLLSEAVTGKLLSEIAALDDAFMIALVGMSLGPVRLKCAMLALWALQDGIKKFNSPNLTGT